MKENLLNYLEDFCKICWYPNGSFDFRELFYLSRPYAKLIKKLYGTPDCFILTDLEKDVDFNNLDENNTKLLFKSTTINITAFNIRELENLDLKFDDTLYNIKKPEYYNKVYAMDVNIKDSLLGEFETKLVYCYVDNLIFASDFLIKNNIVITHVINNKTVEMLVNGKNIGMNGIMYRLGTKYMIDNDIISHCRYNVDATSYLSDDLIYEFDKRRCYDLGYAKMYSLSDERNIFLLHKYRDVLLSINKDVLIEGIEYLSKKIDRSMMIDTNFIDPKKADKEILNLDDLFNVNIEPLDLNPYQIFQDRVLKQRFDSSNSISNWNFNTIYSFIYLYNNNRYYLYCNFNIPYFNKVLLKILFRLEDLYLYEINRVHLNKEEVFYV